jgi:hypothetical protein
LNEKKNDVTEINSVAKGKKKISHDSAHQSDDDDDDDESDSSVHTSDMSTDDESDERGSGFSTSYVMVSLRFNDL